MRKFKRNKQILGEALLIGLALTIASTTLGWVVAMFVDLSYFNLFETPLGRLWVVACSFLGLFVAAIYVSGEARLRDSPSKRHRGDSK